MTITDDLVLAHVLAKRLAPRLQHVAYATRAPANPVGDHAADASRLVDCAVTDLRKALQLAATRPTHVGLLHSITCAMAFEATHKQLLPLLRAGLPGKHIPAHWALELEARKAVQTATSPAEISGAHLSALANLYEIAPRG